MEKTAACAADAAGLQVTTEFHGHDCHPLGEFQSSSLRPGLEFCTAAIAASAAVHHFWF
jgi:hypothetical protein